MECPISMRYFIFDRLASGSIWSAGAPPPPLTCQEVQLSQTTPPAPPSCQGNPSGKDLPLAANCMQPFTYTLSLGYPLQIAQPTPTQPRPRKPIKAEVSFTVLSVSSCWLPSINGQRGNIGDTIESKETSDKLRRFRRGPG
jgi:hypothetical protein